MVNVKVCHQHDGFFKSSLWSIENIRSLKVNPLTGNNNPFRLDSYKDVDSLIASLKNEDLGTYYSFVMSKYIFLMIAEGDISNEIRSKILLVHNDGDIETYKKMIAVIKTIHEKLDTILYDKNYLPRVIEFKTWIWNYNRLRKEIKDAITRLWNPESGDNFYPLGNKMHYLNAFFNSISKHLINDNYKKLIDELKKVLIFKLTGRKVTNLTEDIKNFKEVDMDNVHLKAQEMIDKSYSEGENYL